jgi:hypothetical protein
VLLLVAGHLALLLFAFHLGCCCSLLALVAATCCSFYVVVVYSLSCVVVACSLPCIVVAYLSIHLTFPCVVATHSLFCIVIAYSLLCVIVVTCWGVVFPPFLPCASWSLEHKVKKRKKR